MPFILLEWMLLLPPSSLENDEDEDDDDEDFLLFLKWLVSKLLFAISFKILSMSVSLSDKWCWFGWLRIAVDIFPILPPSNWKFFIIELVGGDVGVPLPKYACWWLFKLLRLLFMFRLFPESPWSIVLFNEDNWFRSIPVAKFCCIGNEFSLRASISFLFLK